MRSLKLVCLILAAFEDPLRRRQSLLRHLEIQSLQRSPSSARPKSVVVRVQDGDTFTLEEEGVDDKDPALKLGYEAK
jgi:hypothetical protein